MIPHKFEMSYNCDHCKALNTLDISDWDFECWTVESGCGCCGPTTHVEIKHRCQVCNKTNTYVIREE